MGKEILYYRDIPQRGQGEKGNKYQLILNTGDLFLMLGVFKRFEDLEKLVKKYFPGTALEKMTGEPEELKEIYHREVDNIYLPLQGAALRELSWGMGRKKVARIEQIEGGEHVLVKVEPMYGFEVSIQFGFDEWANCGLEYISYSSPQKGFLEAMKNQLDQTFGTPEQVVDYHGLDRLMVDHLIKDDQLLARFIRDPEFPYAESFIKELRGLTFRSALKWTRDFTACFLYKKNRDAPGHRNQHNHPYVLEFWPAVLFDFYQEQFVEMYLAVC